MIKYIILSLLLAGCQINDPNYEPDHQPGRNSKSNMPGVYLQDSVTKLCFYSEENGIGNSHSKTVTNVPCTVEVLDVINGRKIICTNPTHTH